MKTTRAMSAQNTYNLYLSFVKALFDEGVSIPTYQEWKANLVEGWGLEF